MTAIRDFQLNGYARVPAFFTPDETAGIASQLERFKRDVLPQVPAGDTILKEGDPQQVAQVSRIDVYDDAFARLADDARYARLAEELLGTPVERQHMHLFNKLPGTRSTVPPHQDIVNFFIDPAHAVTFWLAVEDVDESNGAMSYVPGTHWSGYRPHHLDSGPRRLQHYPESWRTGEELAAGSAGDLFAHHCFAVHVSGPNSSARERPALALTFYPQSAQSYSPEDWLRRFT